MSARPAQTCFCPGSSCNAHASSFDRPRAHSQGAQEATTIEKTCSAQLNGAALEAILAQGPAWEGLRASAQDVWAGHKEDPQKVHHMISDCYGDALPALSTAGLPIPPLPASKGSGLEGFTEGETVLCQEAQDVMDWVLTQGMGVLMVGRTEAAASAATLAVQKALPASCRSCFLAFKV